MAEATFAHLYRGQNPIKVSKPQAPDGFKPQGMPKESRFVGGRGCAKEGFAQSEAFLL